MNSYGLVGSNLCDLSIKTIHSYGLALFTLGLLIVLRQEEDEEAVKWLCDLKCLPMIPCSVLSSVSSWTSHQESLRHITHYPDYWPHYITFLCHLCSCVFRSCLIIITTFRHECFDFYCSVRQIWICRKYRIYGNHSVSFRLTDDQILLA